MPTEINQHDQVASYRAFQGVLAELHTYGQHGLTAEAALTGESLPASKHAAPSMEEVGLRDRDNMIFSGTPDHLQFVISDCGTVTEP